MQTSSQEDSMFTRIRHRLTFSNAIACIALFVALGGISYAAAQLTGASETGAQGPQGERGPEGPKGSPGASRSARSCRRTTSST
jgi:hypothetical protein